MPPDAIHREDLGVWKTLLTTFCDVVKRLRPSTRRRQKRDASGALTEGEEMAWSGVIDEVNERLARLAKDGRWEGFNIPCPGDFLPDFPFMQARPCPSSRPAGAACPGGRAARLPEGARCGADAARAPPSVGARAARRVSTGTCSRSSRSRSRG